MANKKPDNQLAQNREAGFNNEIIEKFEAGLVLNGAEVKSIRAGNVNLKGSYASIEKGEVILKKMHISPYLQAAQNNSEPERPRKLLLHSKEIAILEKKLQNQGLTLIPLSLYLSKGKIKLSLALAKGKKLHDKRETLKKKDSQRHIARLMRK